MTPTAVAHFGDDHNSINYDDGIVNYVWSAFTNSANFNDSFLWTDSHFTSAVIGYNLKYKSTFRYKANNSSFTPSVGLTKLYPTSGIMISRPSAALPSKGLAATIKLTSTDDKQDGHNHDDAGSYVISLNSNLIAGEVGGTKWYNGSAFNADRYKSPLINSYGHPVPLINGKMQQHYWSKPANRPSIISKNITANRDSISYNLRNVYPNLELTSLTRSFTYNRSPSSSVVIQDIATFSSSSRFETALTTGCNWSVVSGPAPNGLKTVAKGRFTCDNLTYLYALIESNSPFNLNKVENFYEFKVNFTRIAIQFNAPVLSADVKVTYTTTP